MNYKGHIIMGFIVMSALIYYFRGFLDLNWIHLITLPIIVYVCSNAADFDHHLGRLRRYVFKMIFASLLLAVGVYMFISIEIFLMYLTIVGLFGLLVYQSHHRGLFHRFLTAPILLIPLLFLGWVAYLIGVLSYCNHIVVDIIYSKSKKIWKIIFPKTKTMRVYSQKC